MGHPLDNEHGVAAPRIVTTEDLFNQIEGAIDGTARWCANDLGMPSLSLREAKENLRQLRELVRLLERAA